MKRMIDKHAVGERIRNIRGGKSVTEYSAKYDVARQTVYNWETGVNVPEIEKLAQMALDASVRIDWLLFGLQPKARTPAYSADIIANTVQVIEQALQAGNIDLAPDTYGRAVTVALEDGNAEQFAADIGTRMRFAVRPRKPR